jgi:ABC-type transporter Mla MlaB component
MLKIIPINDATGITLKFEGKLLAPWADEVSAACAVAASKSSEVRLDLSELSFVDREGVALLQELVLRGIRIVSCSRFVAEMLHTVKS